MINLTQLNTQLLKPIWLLLEPIDCCRLTICCNKFAKFISSYYCIVNKYHYADKGNWVVNQCRSFSDFKAVKNTNERNFKLHYLQLVFLTSIKEISSEYILGLIDACQPDLKNRLHEDEYVYIIIKKTMTVLNNNHQKNNESNYRCSSLIAHYG